MNTRAWCLFLMATFFCLGALNESLPAQGNKAADFWREYIEAFKDPSGFAKKRSLVQKNPVVINEAVTYMILSAANSLVADVMDQAQERIKYLEDLGQMYNLTYRSKRLLQRIEFVKSLDAEKAQTLIDAHSRWNNFLRKHLDKKVRMDPMMLESMIMEGTQILELLEEIKEDFILGDVCQILAVYYETKEDYVELAQVLNKAKRSFSRHKRTEKENEAALKIRNLERDHGIRVNKDGAAEGNVTKKEKKVRKVPDKLGTVKTQYKKDKSPTKFESWRQNNHTDHMFWNSIIVEKGKPLNWPLGDGSLITWEGGVKLLLDVDNTGKKVKTIKAPSGTQNMVDIKIRYASGQGKYRLLVRGLGEEKVLGEPCRFGSATQFALAYARACHLEGKFKGIKFSLVDDNVNGKYDDYGTDMVKIGKEPIQPLGKVMNFSGTLYSIARVKQDGSEVTFEEYVGDTGKLQVKWTGARGVKPTVLVFQCTRGEFINCFFNMASGNPILLPNGYYQFAYGIIAKGAGKKVRYVQVGMGKSEVFEIVENQTVVKEMGAPFDITAGVKSGGKGVLLPGKEIKVYGALKEEYHHFFPESFKPAVSVRMQGGGTICSNKKLGRSGREETNKGGMVMMWYPKSLEFKGSLKKTYEVKIDITDKLLGKIKGKWNEAAEIIQQ